MALNYRKVWKLLNDATPLNSDCGSLCNAACCKGGNEDGMLLFPKEETMYDKQEDWFQIRDSQVVLADGSRIKLFVCQGQCDRSKRPLACRIFPVLPHIDDEDFLDFVPDLRGALTCPLLLKNDPPIAPVFIDTLFAAFESILEDECVLEFIALLSKQNDELAEDFRRLYG